MDAQDEAIEALLRLIDWRSKQIIKYEGRPLLHLAHLLGYKESWEIEYVMKDQDHRLCKMLSGPHGLTIYKMLLLKQQENQIPV